jgi:biotin transport system substrate-specific component
VIVRASVSDRSLSSVRPLWARTLGAVLFAALTAAGAAITVPLFFSPVPVTLQTLAVVLAGAVLGPVWGPLSQVLYIGAGLSGLPVFAGGMAGPGVLAGPTGGYLVGFVVAAWVAGLLTRPGASWPRLGSGLLLAQGSVFLCGVPHLMLFTGQSLPLAVKLGLLPFLPGLGIKTLVAAGALRSKTLLGWFRS